MPVSTQKQLSTKQAEVLCFLLKVRLATVHHIIQYLYPELKGKNKNDKEYSNARKNVSKVLKRLSDADYIERHRIDHSVEVYYYLSLKGQLEIYLYLGISESHRGTKDGFDFNLGYFDWAKPPVREHALFQTDVYCYLMWLNRLVENATKNEVDARWQFGDIKLANICSWRDNLHAAPRNTKSEEKNLEYKPDGEILFNHLIFNDRAERTSSIGQSLYFLENDRGTEYSRTLESKFERLALRLNELKQSKQLSFYKGMIVVLPESNYANAKKAQSIIVNDRFGYFVSRFNSICGKYLNEFSIICTPLSDLDKTLLSLRTEFQYNFKQKLIDSWKFKGFQSTFNTSISPVPYKEKGRSCGDIITNYTIDGKYMCVFFNIEGLNSLKWRKAIEVYNALVEFEHDRAQGSIVIPIVTFSLLYPNAPQQIKEELMDKHKDENFFKKLYVLDLRINRPILYRNSKPIDFEEAEFIIK